MPALGLTQPLLLQKRARFVAVEDGQDVHGAGDGHVEQVAIGLGGVLAAVGVQQHRLVELEALG